MDKMDKEDLLDILCQSQSDYEILNSAYRYIDKLEKENKKLKDYKSRNEKAIEYIGNGNIGIPKKTREKFIKILKGEYDENKTN